MPAPLAHSLIEPPGAPADAPTVVLLHGILGSRNNWRGFGRALAAAAGVRVRLVDLRNHGQSHPAQGPHTVAACAQDLAALCASLGDAPRAVIGHSFGGKVALAWAELAEADAGCPAFARVWVLDALPGPGRGDPESTDVARVIRTLQGIGLPMADRALVSTRLRAAGFGPGLVAWMSTNLRRTPAGFVWKFHLPGVIEMLRDYWALDLWPWLESPWRHTAVHVVRASQGDRWVPEVLARFADADPPEAGPLRLHTLPRSGHWVHVDNPQGLLEIVTQEGGP